MWGYTDMRSTFVFSFCVCTINVKYWFIFSFFKYLINVFFLRKILKKRTNLEYKLRRRTKCKEDFMRYVQVNININRPFVVLEG